MVEEKPHCGDRHSWSMSTNRAASSIRRFSWSLLSSSPRLVVTSKRGELEAKDDIKRRIEEASKFVDIDQLCLSPQCGFSSTMEGNSLSLDQQIAKLRLVAETAEEVWGTQ